MRDYHQELRDLQAQAQRRGQLEVQAAELEKEYEAWKKKAFLYEDQMNQEQADVDKLEGRSLSAFFAGLRGNKEERLDKERQEARAARVKYEMAVLERNQAQDQLRRVREELADLDGIPARREELMTQWAQAVKAMGGPVGQAILDLEEQRAWHQGQRREIREALAAGQEAMTRADEIMASLSDAEGWGTWDMLGGGMLSSLMKYEAIDQAQAKVEGLQLALRRFRTELVDVSIDADLNFTMDGTTQFFDVFFDNIFTDWAVMDEIGKSQNRVGQLRDQIRALEESLTETDSQHQADLAQLDRELEDLLLREVPS